MKSLTLQLSLAVVAICGAFAVQSTASAHGCGSYGYSSSYHAPTYCAPTHYAPTYYRPTYSYPSYRPHVNVQPSHSHCW